jgi:hypothetical protein
MDLVMESRWQRKRKLLPSQKLKYPSEQEVDEVSRLAAVKYPFGSHIDSIILDAHLDDASYKNISIPAVRKRLTRVATLTTELAKQLNAIDVGSKGSFEHAGRLLEIELGKVQWRESMFLLPEYIDLLSILRGAASAGAAKTVPRRNPKTEGKSKRGRKRGSVENPAFNRFVRTLWSVVRQYGGKLTIYQDRIGDASWAGSWLPVLEILREYLPANFFPRGELGGSVYGIVRALKKHIEINSITDS